MLRDIHREWYLQVLDCKDLLHPKHMRTSPSVTSHCSSDSVISEKSDDDESKLGYNGYEHHLHIDKLIEAERYTSIISSLVTSHEDDIYHSANTMPLGHLWEPTTQETETREYDALQQRNKGSSFLIKTFSTLSPSQSMCDSSHISVPQTSSVGLIAEIYIRHGDNSDCNCLCNENMDDEQKNASCDLERLVVLFDRTRGFAKLQRIDETNSLHQNNKMNETQERLLQRVEIHKVGDCGESGFFCSWRCSSSFNESLLSLLLSPANKPPILSSCYGDDFKEINGNIGKETYDDKSSCSSNFLNALSFALNKELAKSKNRREE